MKLKQLFTDERAVSPVIGVILMVAITVILAAVIGTFVLGLGQNVQSTPSASFDFDFTGSTEVDITHNGGDSIESDRLSIVIAGTTAFDGSGVAGTDSDSDNLDDTYDADDSKDNGWFDSTVSAGSSITITDGSSGDNIQVVFTDESGESSATLGQAQFP